MGCDYGDLKNFANSLNNLCKENDILDECAKELAARLYRKVVATVENKRGTEGTPVGKKPDVDDKILEKYWKGYGGGTLQKSWEIGKIKKTSAGVTIDVTNICEYASYVEFGHRQDRGRYVPALGKSLSASFVPGTFMLKMSESEIKAETPAILEKKIKQKLEDLLPR